MRGAQFGEHNLQINLFTAEPAPGPAVAGGVPQAPPALQPRDGLMAALRTAGQGVCVVRAVTGMRGVGKTQLAAAYARECVNAGWRLVAWVNAEDHSAVLTGMAVAADRLGISKPGTDLAVIAAEVRNRVEADGERCLIVFDSLPLALAQAAAVIVAQRLTFPVYLARLRSYPVEEYLAPAKGDPYPRSVAQAVLLSIDTAAADDPGGLCGSLLDLVSLLSPAGVARELLQVAGSAGVLPGDPQAIDSALGRLADCSLLAFSGDDATVSVHRLVMRVARERRAKDGSLLTFAETACAVLAAARTPLDPVWRHRDAVRSWVRHVTALFDYVAPHANDENATLTEALFALRAGALWCLANLGDSPRQSIGLGEPLVSDLDRVLGDSHWRTLAARNNLGLAYKEAGRTAEAIALLERVTAQREHLLGETHPDTLSSLGNLAGAYDAAGRLDKAIPLFERTLACRETLLGPAAEDTLLCRNNLAYAYREAGRPAEAIALFEASLAAGEPVLGQAHPLMLSCRSNLAVALADAARRGCRALREDAGRPAPGCSARSTPTR
jgi:hypothetical protein